MDEGVFICQICGAKEPKYIGYIKNKPYCRRCISFIGEDYKQSINLKEKIKYTTGSKYLYLTTEEYVGEYTEQLPANSDLVLDRGQIIYVFWKNEDSKDSPYLYTKYGEGTILKATTKLIKSKANEDGALQTKLLNSGYEGSGQIFGDLNDDIWNINDSILGTTKTLTIKTLNETKLNESKNDCYWITNDRRTNNLTNKDEYFITFITI